MPKDLPYMKWYPAEFEDDEDVKLMTFEEVGFYVHCMNHAWTNKGLPGTMDGLARLFHIDQAKAAQLWVVVGKKFLLVDGRFVNRRQEMDRAAAIEISSKRAANGKLGAQAKHKHLPRFLVANACENDGNCQNFASVRASNSNSNYESSSNSENLEALPSESPEYDGVFDQVAKAIHARHPARRRDLTPWQIEDQLRQIVIYQRARADPDTVAYLFAIDRRHKALCESEEWQEHGRKFAKSLSKWLKPEGGLYDIETASAVSDEQGLSLDEKAKLLRSSFSEDPTAEYHEFMRSRIRHQKAS